ncbi:hypothetical protein [Hydrogenophaga sp.]|uniref:hypothetical protein n=1 Tax=Hydrogenophaga sp. TaxID=1904254 RepID=UPI00356232C6
MAIPWLIALKVIPWGDVIEHAPKVLNAARKLMDRQTEPAQRTAGTAIETASSAPPSLGELQNRVVAAQQDIERLVETQAELTRTVAELAEQNAQLVGAVQVLRLRTRVLLTVAAVLALATLWLALR